MKRYCLMAYRQMKLELEQAQKTKTCLQLQVEFSFRIAYRYWAAIREKLSSYQFKNDEREIGFFKVLKPKFTSEIEYYTLLYHGILFEPPDPGSSLQFWTREYSRLKNFRVQHRPFIRCYKNHRSELTPYYFLCRYYIGNNNFNDKIYDAGSKALTNGDCLVAPLLALTRYQRYAKKKLAELSEKGEGGLQNYPLKNG